MGPCKGVDEKRFRKIDVHTHIIPKEWPDWNQKFGYKGWLTISHDENNGESATLLDGNGGCFRKIDANCWSIECRLKECKEAHVDIQVLSTVPGIGFNYWAKPEDALEVAQFINNDLARVVKEGNGKFIGLGTVPLQDPQLAILEMTRCVKELGFPGIQIGSHVNDWNLDNDVLEPFWQTVSDFSVAVFVHPWDMQNGPRHSKHWFPWLVDMPNETGLAIASMILGGVYDRWPNLRVCFAHGGGTACQIIGRIGHGFHARPDLCQTVTNTHPMEAFKKIWVDSLVHDEDILKLLITKIGPEKVCLGSDYPFPLGEVPRPGLMIESCNFEKEDPQQEADLKDALLYRNVVSFLNMPELLDEHHFDN